MKKILTILAGFFCAFALSATDPSLVLHLKFDEGEGEVIKDHSGKGHHAKLVNGNWEKFGVRGKAVELKGKDSYINIPWSKDLDLAEEFTYSIWFKMQNTKRGMNLFARGNYNIGFQCYVYDSFISFHSRNVKGKSLIYTNLTYATRPESPYYHLVVTSTKGEKKGERILRFYVNGKQRANARRFGGEKDLKLVGAMPVNRKIDTTIGKYSSHEGQWFKGIVDEAKVYNRPLSAKEIEEEYKVLSVPEVSSDVKKKELKKVILPPLKSKNAAIYIPDSRRGQTPFQKVEWIEERLKEAGMRVRRIADKDLAALPSSSAELLVMPYARMALEGEDAIFKFLKRGGNVIAATCIPSVYNPLYPKDPTKQHGRGWFAPFLIRKLDASWAWAKRNAKNPLEISDEASTLVGDLLPVSYQDAKVTFTGIDRWNVIKGSDGGYGDGTNYVLAGDVSLDLYRERTGAASDFVLYRYYNTQIFGSTFTNVGAIGEGLLKGAKGKDVFKAILHLQEMKFPQEQEKAYYKDLCDLALLWSDFSWEYIILAAKMRDAAIAAYLDKKDHRKEMEKLTAMNDRFQTILKDHKQHDQYLAGKTDAKTIAALTKKMIQEIRKAQKIFASYDKEASRLLSNVKKPAGVPVKHRYGTLQLIASLTLPANLYRFRGALFDEMKRMGVTVYSGTDHPWYVLDKQANAKRKGISRDHKFLYAAEPNRILRMGTFNPVDGSVKDGKGIPFPYAVFHKTLKERFALYDKAGIKQFRIGTGDEMGIGYSYWGTPAQKEFQEYLKKYYKNSIEALNGHCRTSYKKFEDILLPRRQPATASEHAIWEHWRNCREARLEGLYALIYKEIKKLKKDLDVFTMPSTGSMESPLYAVNFYNVTKYSDVNAIDGTTTSSSREWIFNDLTRKQVLTSEWGGTYADVNEHRLQGMLWKELSGGMTGAELHVYSWGSDSISFLDILDRKNLRGAAIGQFMKEIRTLDHVLLDGKRAGNEIGILFSQTSRIHDQNWGMNGQKTYSPHVTAVSNYYALFLTTQRNARVIPEEMLLEDTLPSPVKFLILPQTIYLTEEVQKKLLAFAENGGILLTEGRVGQFDAFGMPSDLIFRTAGVIPTYTASTKFTSGRLSDKLPEGDRIFAPAGKGEILASFDTKEAAILSVPYGKGRIIVSGLNSGLAKYKSFPAITEELLREANITPRLIVSDPAVISREWIHGKDTYLIFNKVLSTVDMKETLIRIRGKVKVEDYLFGKNVDTEYKNGYTSFRTLLTNGGRVFRIQN
ncbi:MAG: beta-galactosidase, partial [Lentisphaeria bacterium]|nr:beta-galactosidase [Lentisphaeria bacterium]